MTEKVTLFIDDKEIKAEKGEKVLWAALSNDIFIPNLCAIKEEKRPSASCRLCFVEVEGRSAPVTSCNLSVKEGMKIKTRSPRIDRLVKTAFELLISDHEVKCASCPAKKSCNLITIAKERGLKLKQKRFKNLEREKTVDDSAETFTLDRYKCVLCGRCVWTDREKAKAGVLGFTQRGLNRKISTYLDQNLSDSKCTKCAECVEVCPVGALFFKNDAATSKLER